MMTMTKTTTTKMTTMTTKMTTTTTKKKKKKKRSKKKAKTKWRMPHLWVVRKKIDTSAVRHLCDSRQQKPAKEKIHKRCKTWENLLSKLAQEYQALMIKRNNNDRPTGKRKQVK